MSLRRALHQAVDLVLDAIEEERAGTPQKQKRAPRVREPLPMPSNATPEDVERVVRKMAAKGFRPAK